MHFTAVAFVYLLCSAAFAVPTFKSSEEIDAVKPYRAEDELLKARQFGGVLPGIFGGGAGAERTSPQGPGSGLSGNQFNAPDPGPVAPAPNPVPQPNDPPSPIGTAVAVQPVIQNPGPAPIGSVGGGASGGGALPGGGAGDTNPPIINGPAGGSAAGGGSPIRPGETGP